MEQQGVDGIISIKTKVKSLKCTNFYRKPK